MNRRIQLRSWLSQVKLRVEKLVMRHSSEGSPRNALVKGEGVVCLCYPLSPITLANLACRGTDFCICLDALGG